MKKLNKREIKKKIKKNKTPIEIFLFFSIKFKSTGDLIFIY